MSFKDMLKDDLDIFINTEEFSEEVILGEKEYIAILTYSDKKSIPLYEGIVKNVDLTLSLKHDKELIERYPEEVAMMVNGVPYIVNKIHSVEGILTFYLFKNQAR